MDFDYTTETITPDVTTVLTIGGTGALQLPSGNTGQEPGTAAAGAIRWNTSGTWVEYYDGTVWQHVSSSSGTVSSFSAGTTGLTPNTATTGAITLAGTLSVANGGTGITTAPAAGQVLYSSSTTYAPITLSTIAVTSLSGTSGNITVSASTGAVTLNLATAGTAGTYGQVTTDTFGRVTSGVTINDVTHGGTGASTLTLNGVVYGNGTSAVGITTAGTTGQVLVGNTGAAPSFSALSGVAVTTFSGGTTGLTPNTATTGAVTLAGTLVLGNGGTGANLTNVSGGIVYGGSSAMAFTAAGLTNQILQSNGSGTPTWTGTPTISGANILSATIPNSALTNSSIIVTGGTGLGVSGSPVSLGGTITLSNTGVTSLVAGTGITVSSATGAVTVGTANIPNTSLTNSSVTVGTTNIALGATSTSLAGMTGITFVSGTVTGVSNPVNPTDVVNLQYLQAQQAGLEWKLEVAAATTASLTATYSNGTSGVGATLTNAGALAAFAVDGYTALLGDRILVKNQSSAFQNGIYTVTTLGSASISWVLTRSIDNNTTASMNNATTLVTNGTTNANSGWTQTTANPTIGAGSINWVQFSGAGAGVSSFQTSLSGLTPNTSSAGAITLAGTLGATSGGTGTGTAPTAGQLLVGQTGGTYTPFTVTSGTGISTTTGSGTFQINNTGVTSAAAGTGISVSGATGAVTFSNTGVLSFSAGTTGLTPNTSTTGAITLGGTLVVANGGTGATTLTAHGVLLGEGTGAITATSVGATGTVLSGNTGADPTFQTLSTLAVTSIAGTTNQITVSASTGAVTLSTPSTFIAPGTITASTGLTVTSGGALVTAGGVTVSTLTANSFLYSGTAGLLTTTTAPTNGQLLIGSTGSAPVAATLTAGANVYVTNAAGSITIAGPKYYAESSTSPVVTPTVTASQGVAIGSAATSTVYGVQSYANGQFSSIGDAQGVRVIMRNSTTTNTPTELFVDGSSTRLTLPLLGAGCAWTFEILVVARRTDATGSVGSWIFQGMIYNNATAASTTMSPVNGSKTTVARIGSIASVNDPIISADTTNGSLKILVTGVTGQTYQWVANVNIVQTYH